MTPDFWHGRRVLVTGHTGFKGGWLCLKLMQAGAIVTGLSLDPPTDPSLFVEAKIADAIAASHIADLRDAAATREAVLASDAEIIFHLAAQPLVRASYADPAGTFATNVMGLVNLLEAARELAGLRAIVNVTTDKVYDNAEWPWAYRENDPLGGRDPYAASKACAELVTRCWRDSFLVKNGVAVATARAGNVIGGGDWAADRLVPDALRAFDAGEALLIRAPDAVRPWQHVLEPVAGYIALAEALVREPARFAEAWNFGPSDEDARPVRWIADRLCAVVPGACWRLEGDGGPKEAGLLKVDSSKALAALPWRPKWRLAEALDLTARWHADWRSGGNAQTLCIDQIAAHEAA